MTELVGLDRALERFCADIMPGVLTWWVDNNSALAAIKNEGSTRSWQLSCQAVKIVKKVPNRGIWIESVQVSSEENMLTDAASHYVDVVDWSLKDAVCQRMWVR